MSYCISYLFSISYFTISSLIIPELAENSAVCVPTMMPLEDAMAVVSSIGIVLLGSLPTAELLQRVLKKPLLKLVDGNVVGDLLKEHGIIKEDMVK